MRFSIQVSVWSGGERQVEIRKRHDRIYLDERHLSRLPDRATGRVEDGGDNE